MPNYTKPTKNDVIYHEPSAKGWFSGGWFSNKWFSKGKGELSYAEPSKSNVIYTEPSKGE